MLKKVNDLYHNLLYENVEDPWIRSITKDNEFYKEYLVKLSKDNEIQIVKARLNTFRFIGTYKNVISPLKDFKVDERYWNKSILVKIFAFAASDFSFLCLMLFHFECPDIFISPKKFIEYCNKNSDTLTEPIKSITAKSKKEKLKKKIKESLLDDEEDLIKDITSSSNEKIKVKISGILITLNSSSVKNSASIKFRKKTACPFALTNLIDDFCNSLTLLMPKFIKYSIFSFI
mgnify:CR=1 FL=1